MARRWAVNAGDWKPSSAEFEFFLAILPLCEWGAVLRFVRIEDRKSGLLSRLLQRMLVHSVLGIPYKEIIIHRTPQGKPFLASNGQHSTLNFNVSHHGDYVVIASEPQHLVGVDVMSHDPGIREPPIEYVSNFRSSFTELEWNTIMNAGSDQKKILHQFYRHWCLKEAYIKAIGTGLGFELQRLEFFYPDGENWGRTAQLRIDGEVRGDWSFVLHELDTDHWVCVAKGPQKNSHQGTEKNPSICGEQFKTLTVDDLIPKQQS